MPREVLSFAATLVAAGALLLAAWGKLRDRQSFRAGVHAYALVPTPVEGVVAATLPVAEIVIAGLMILGVAAPWPAFAAAALLGTFATAIAITAQRGRDIPCHCFGGSEHHRVGAGAALRSLLLALLAVLAGWAAPVGSGWGLTLGTLTEDGQLALVSLTAAFALAVILIEPTVLLAQATPAAWRRRGALAQAEAAERRRCKATTPEQGRVP